MDTAAARCGAGVRLCYEEKPVYLIPLNIRATVELIRCAGKRLTKARLRGQIIKLDTEVDLSRCADCTGLGIDCETVYIADSDAATLGKGAGREINRRNESWNERISKCGVPEDGAVHLVIVSEAGVSARSEVLIRD